MKTELLKAGFCQNYESPKMEKWAYDEQICRGFVVKRKKEPENVPIVWLKASTPSVKKYTKRVPRW